MTRSIRDVRRQQELTQTAFAQLLGKTQGLIGKEARGEVRLPTDTWWSMAEALGVPIAQHFARPGNGSRETTQPRRRRLSSTGGSGASDPPMFDRQRAGRPPAHVSQRH